MDLRLLLDIGALLSIIGGSALWLWNGGVRNRALRAKADHKVAALAARVDAQVASLAASFDSHVQVDEVQQKHTQEALARIEAQIEEGNKLRHQMRDTMQIYAGTLGELTVKVNSATINSRLGAELAVMIKRQRDERAERNSQSSTRLRALRDVSLPGDEVSS